MQIDIIERPEGEDFFRPYRNKGQRDDVFAKFTREDGKSIVVAVPDRAFDDYEGVFGLNMVFGDHYE